jgi:hypothetical protein
MTAHSPIEERLRAALDARARLISAHDLSPARPPAGRAWGTRRIRRGGSALAGTAAVAATLAFLLLSGPPERSHPTPPARDPRITDTPVPAVPSPAAPHTQPSNPEPR